MASAGLSISKRSSRVPRSLVGRKPRSAARSVGSPQAFVGAAPRLGTATSVASPASQTRLEVSRPNDEFEREADRVADQVMLMAEPGLQRACACGGICPLCRSDHLGPTMRIAAGNRAPLAQRLCTRCGEELERKTAERDEELLQPKTSTGSTSMATPFAAQVSATLAESGTSLPDSVRRYFEPRFGHDFGGVRIHRGTAASRSARMVNARAYTVGRHIVFQDGQDAPETAAGRKLLAHELTH